MSCCQRTIHAPCSWSASIPATTIPQSQYTITSYGLMTELPSWRVSPTGNPILKDLAAGEPSVRRAEGSHFVLVVPGVVPPSCFGANLLPYQDFRQFLDVLAPPFARSSPTRRAPHHGRRSWQDPRSRQPVRRLFGKYQTVRSGGTAWQAPEWPRRVATAPPPQRDCGCRQESDAGIAAINFPSSSLAGTRAWLMLRERPCSAPTPTSEKKSSCRSDIRS
jgi:hypothetical protein